MFRQLLTGTFILLTSITFSQEPQPLILEYVRSIASSEYISVNDIAVDSDKNVYATGAFEQEGFFDPNSTEPTVTGLLQYDAFLVKIKPNGTLAWIKHYHETDSPDPIAYQLGANLCVDQNDNIIVCGYFFSDVDFNPGGAPQVENSSGSNDIFLLKLDSDGNLIWHHCFGNIGTDSGHELICDAENNLYMSGAFNGTVDFDPGPAVHNITAQNGLDMLGSEYDAFLLKLDEDGNFQWVNHLANDLSTGIYGINKTSSGKLFITGFFSDTTHFISETEMLTLATSSYDDIFVACINVAGEFEWANKMGGSGIDLGTSVASDLSNNCYITGGFRGAADFDPGEDTLLLTAVGNYDIFVAKYSPSGDLLWAKHLQGQPDGDMGRGIEVDSSYRVWVTGHFKDSVDFDPGEDTYLLSNIGSSTFLLELDSAGNFNYVQNVPGNNSAHSIIVPNENEIYLCGKYYNTTVFSFGGAADTLNAERGGYILKLGRGYLGLSESSLPEIVVYPNPTRDFLYIQIENKQQFRFEIYTAHGQKIRTTDSSVIDIKSLSKGTYFLRICSPKNETIEIRKFLKV